MTVVSWDPCDKTMWENFIQIRLIFNVSVKTYIVKCFNPRLYGGGYYHLGVDYGQHFDLSIFPSPPMVQKYDETLNSLQIRYISSRVSMRSEQERERERERARDGGKE